LDEEIFYFTLPPYTLILVEAHLFLIGSLCEISNFWAEKRKIYAKSSLKSKTRSEYGQTCLQPGLLERVSSL